MQPIIWYEYIFAILATPAGFFFGLVFLFCICVASKYFWDWVKDTSDCKIHTELYREAMRLKGKPALPPKPSPVFNIANDHETAFSAIGSVAVLIVLIVLAVVLH